MTRRTLPLMLLGGAASAAPTKKQKTAIAEIQQADLAFCEATKQRGLDGWMSYFADEAVAFPPGKPTITGRENLRANYSRMFSQPGFSLIWRPVKADAAASGDMGYTIGTAEFSRRGDDGKIVTQPTKYLTVWKKQPDGSWKVVADLGN
ncbi:MAG: DUF4440 domain-containing protein [Acidobacteria bacterium]|nr:DUF4440 domain-containing protein [Acidobacteriota bacterium]